MLDYLVTTGNHDGVDVYILHERERARAEVVPQWGNNCFVFYARESVLEPVTWADFSKKPSSYGIPVLFPYPNRLRNSEFTFQGRTYRVSRPQHGYVRHKAWQVTAAGAGADGAWLVSRFAADEEILAEFPFPFLVEMKYTLRDCALLIDFRATNTGQSDMPVGFGIHPYFRWPAFSRLSVPAAKRWELADSLPTGQLLDVTGAYDLRGWRDTEGLALDDIYTDIGPGKVRCLLADDDTGTQTAVEFEGQACPQIVVYTAPAPRRALCIEPMSCPTDAFNLHAQGLDSNVIVLPPDESVTFHIRIASEYQ